LNFFLTFQKTFQSIKVALIPPLNFSFKGWGLGLSICKTIFEMMNADFGVESEYGKGSTFWFEVLIKNPSIETIDPQIPSTYKNAVIMHSDKIYMRYLTQLLEMMKIENVKSSNDSFIDIDLNNKNSILIVEESLIKMVPENVKGIHGNALIIGNQSKEGFSNIFEPLSVSYLLNLLTFQKDKRDSSNSDQKIQCLRILIVDDNLMILRSLENLLKKMELGTIHSASNGEEALQMIVKNEKYDVILMDIQMPLKDGIQAVKELRELDDLEKSKTLVFALTGNSISNSKEEQCIKWKMDDILMKPVNKKEILQSLKKISIK
jgi:CheY-like chemotaxis protein